MSRGKELPVFPKGSGGQVVTFCLQPAGHKVYRNFISSRVKVEWPRKNPPEFSSGLFALRFAGGLAVVADGFDGAAFHGFFAQLFFVGRGGLFVNDGVAAIVIALEIGGGGFAAEIAINALVVHIVVAGGVFGIFVCCVSHKFIKKLGGHDGWPGGNWQARFTAVRE